MSDQHLTEKQPPYADQAYAPSREVVYVEREVPNEPQCCGCSIRFCVLALLGPVIIFQTINIFVILYQGVYHTVDPQGLYVLAGIAVVFLLLNIFGFWSNSVRNLNGMLTFLTLFLIQTLFTAAYNLYYIFTTDRKERDYGFGTLTVSLIVNFFVFYKLFTHYIYARTRSRAFHGEQHV